MRVQEIINLMGGRPYVMRLCGVSSSQISHFYSQNFIPIHHIKLFMALRPEIKWEELVDTNSQEFIPVLMDKGLRDVRYARLRNRARRQGAAEK